MEATLHCSHHFLADDSSSSSRTGTAASFLALVVLNHDLPRRTLSLWNRAQLRVCADGGANRLYTQQATPRLVPEFIVGDLDSVEPGIMEFYSSKGTKIVDKSGDQDTTDLHKCVTFMRDFVPTTHNLEILVLGSMGGRFDHEMGNLNVLYLFRDLRIILLNDENIVFLLPAGFRHQIEALPGTHCGLIPLGSPSQRTSTTGLKWNLSEAAMGFGSVVSTSNVVTDEVVTVVSDVDLLWTMEVPV